MSHRQTRCLQAALIGCCLALVPSLSGAQTTQDTAVSMLAAPDNESLPSAPEPSSQQTKSTNQNQPDQQDQTQQSPTKSATEPSLGDLGFTPQQTQPNAQLQAMLNRRTQMLKIHQRLGLITLLPMAATVITGPMVSAKGKNGQVIREPSQANLDFHAALGGTTAGLYFATAYYAIFAPKVPGEKRRGAIRLHRALAFIHGPGMIATPILGAMAFKQEQAGEKVHGIASAHGAVAWCTVAAYGAAIISVSWPIRLKF